MKTPTIYKKMIRAYVRRDAFDNWVSVNPVLQKDEIAYEVDNDVFRIGDGVRKYLDLPKYAPIKGDSDG